MNEQLLDELLSSNHLLIAGMTGSGKSVLLNQLIPRMNGLLYLIDLKKVELHRYRRKACMYADTQTAAVRQLEYVLKLIDKRYKRMQRRGQVLSTQEDVWVCIDELADLMVTARKQVEPLLVRIGQIGRAARVHLVMCTQQPAAAIIPTSIKLNCERVALRCMTAQQSKQIIEMKGAEELPKYGWCIWQGQRREITL